jgi:hypothetical protein
MERGEELFPGHIDSTQRRDMFGSGLRVHDPERMEAEKCSQRVKRALARVALMAEHTLAEKHPTDSNPIDATDQPIAKPRFAAVCIPQIVKATVPVDHLFGNPRSPLARARRL